MSLRPSVRLVCFQTNQPFHRTLQATTTITSQSIQQTDAPLRVSKAFKEEKGRRNNEIPIGILIDIEWMIWFWCSCHYLVQWRMYLYMFLSLHTYTNTQQTLTQAPTQTCASRDERNGVMTEIVIFFGCAQWQSSSNSVQFRAVNVCSAWSVVIFYIVLSIIHTETL